MPGKILGIDISKHNISAVQIISGLKGYQVISCFSAPIAHDNLEEAFEKLSNSLDLKSDKCILTIPASNIFFRNVNTPFRDAKKIRQTLPFEIEPYVPFAVDEMVIDYNPTDENNPSSILTASINKNYVAEYIEKLKNAGVDPDIIDIRPAPAAIWLMDQESAPDNGVYMDLEYEHPVAVIFQNKKIALIRELPCSLSETTEDSESRNNEYASPEILENFINTICRETNRTVHSFGSQAKNGFAVEKVYYGGRLSAYKDISSILNTCFENTPERINISRDSRLRMDTGVSGIYEPAMMDNALAVSIRENKKNSGFNLRRGEFAVKRKIFGPGKDIRTTALLLGIFLILMIFNSGVDYYYLSKKHSMVEAQFIRDYDKKFPQNKGLDARTKRLTVKQKLTELRNSSSDLSGEFRPDQKVLDIIKDISQRIPDSYPIDINTMQIKNREVTISGTTDGYDTVDKIANALKPSSLFKNVEIVNSSRAKDGNGIKFELKLERTE